MSRALIAEDAEPVRRLLTIVLQRQGFEVVGARNGREALEQIEKNHGFDLILLDLMMPEVSGYEVLEHIKVHHPEWLNRLVIVTAVSERELGRIFGADPDIRIVRKPFDISQITQVINNQMIVAGPHSTLTCLSCNSEGSFHVHSEKEAWEQARGAGWHVVTFVKEDTATGKLKTLAITFCPNCAAPPNLEAAPTQ